MPSWNFTPSLSLKRQVLGSTCSRTRKSRRDAAVVGIDLGEGLGDVLLDDPADVRSARLAEVDDIRFFGQHDGDVLVLRLRAPTVNAIDIAASDTARQKPRVASAT